MQLPELNLPINFAGRDGFYWWMGQIEPFEDPKEYSIKNRFKVRIIGQHVKSCDAIKPEDLPWAQVMMPVTHPTREGNNSYHAVELEKGDWVIGFFLDGAEGQKPIIMGQMPRTTNSSSTRGVTTNVDEPCLAFTRTVEIINPQVSVIDGKPDNTGEAPVGKAGKTTPLGAAGNNLNSENNGSGRDFCVQIADIPCKTNNGTEQSRFETFLSEMLYNIQSSGGNFGTNILSSTSGTLLDYAGAAQAYTTKLFGVARAYINNAKGYVRGLIKQGVASMLQWMLGFSVDPTTGKKTKIGIFGTVTAYLNEQLDLINCTFADLEKKLFDFLFNLITDLILSAVSSATCKIESIINDVLNEILSFLDNAILAILGPLSALLGLIASPLNILGSALAFLLELLGITCSGPGGCASADQTKYCKGKSAKPLKNELAALDKLIADAEGIPGVAEGLQSSCTDYLYLPCPSSTSVATIGGTADPDGLSDISEDCPPGYTNDPTKGCISITIDNILDEFLAGFILDGPVGTTSEDGGSTTFTVRLKSLPKYSVTVTPSSQSLSEGTVSGALTFTTSDWYTPQTVTVTGVDDSLFDGDVAYTIRLAGTSTDSNYNNIVDFIDITNKDNEVEISDTVIILKSEGTFGITVSSYTNRNFPTNQFIVSTTVSTSLEGTSSYNFIPVITQQTLDTDYTLTADKTVVNEGESITFTLTAINNFVPDGTEFNYLMFGFIQSSDFENNTTIGTMKMFNNVATKSIKISDNISIATFADVTFNVAIANKSKLFTIVNTNPVTPEPVLPPSIFKPPLIGDPEVDDDGKIISIPIVDPGDPYIIPPLIKVYGEGVGAVAIAELDINGKLSNIKILRPGRGYLPNRKNNNCVIDGYNLIKPGVGYTYEPKVFIDGDPTIARAIIKNGFVTGLEILNKTKVFSKVPRVRIIGNGSGAIINPTFTCLDKPKYDEYVSTVAPSGVDSVIDCP